MKRWIQRANSKLSIGWAAALLSGMSMLSIMLGLFRERLLNANFGVGSLELDAYRVAFKFPDFMFIILVSGALSVTFIPVLADRLGKNNKKSAWDLSSSLLNLLSIVIFISSILIIISAGFIVRTLLAPDMDPAGQDLAVLMMRIIAINPLLFAVSAVLTSVQQAFGRFFFYATAPLIYNLGIIIGILFLAPSYGIVGVAYGVVLGSFMQLAVATMGMIGLGFEYHNGINWRNRGFRQVLKLLPWRSIDQGIDYFNNLVEIRLASGMGTGMINAWEVAFTLHFVPINLIGIAVSTAAFPQMSERIAQGRPDLFKKELIQVLRAIIWLALPVCVIAYFGRGYLVRLLVAEGNTTISSLLGLLVVAIFFRAIFHLASRAFYAQEDTKTPLYVSIFAILLNIVLAVYFVKPWDDFSGGIWGLAIAQSIVAIFEVMILFVILSKRMPGLFKKDFFTSVTRMVSATGLTAAITYFMIKAFPLRAADVGFFSLVPKFVLIIGVSLGAYLLFSFIFNIRESRFVVEKMRSIVYRPVKIQ